MSMNYEEVLSYLYNNLPMFQRVGGTAYKKDLSNTIRICEYLGHPEKAFRSVHIAGTNGKGSSSHYISSILQEAAYKTGLYTSPHLKSFTERIRINGVEMEKSYVTDFINRHREFIEMVHPSFFEITVGMAFDYFREKAVDIAVIEVGMGGRLDSTNVITPEVALITNISPDHQQWLGNSLEEIAAEKAGIIKANVPLVIGENQPEIFHVFEERAFALDAGIHKAFERWNIQGDAHEWKAIGAGGHSLLMEVNNTPEYQQLNLPGVLTVTDILRLSGFSISDENIVNGIERMHGNTGLRGRWQVLGQNPLLVCDVGHNVAGITFVLQQLDKLEYQNLHMVLGMVSDKDILPVIRLLPKSATYYFCEAKIPRAMPAEELFRIARENGLNGQICKEVNDAVELAREIADKEDVIFIGGSNFVFAEINEL